MNNLSKFLSQLPQLIMCTNKLNSIRLPSLKSLPSNVYPPSALVAINPGSKLAGASITSTPLKICSMPGWNSVISALKLAKIMLDPFYATGIVDGVATGTNDALLFAPFICGPNKTTLRNTKKL